MASSRLRLVDRDRPVTFVDSCVLLDLMTDDPTWADWSETELAKAQDEGPVVINPIVYAEVSVAYAAIEDLDAVLPVEDFARESLPYEAGFLAGKAFLQYRKRGGQKTAALPDFYIGAHAAVRGFRLLTRNATRYQTYFPTVRLICP